MRQEDAYGCKWAFLFDVPRHQEVKRTWHSPRCFAPGGWCSMPQHVQINPGTFLSHKITAAQQLLAQGTAPARSGSIQLDPAGVLFCPACARHNLKQAAIPAIPTDQTQASQAWRNSPGTKSCMKVSLVETCAHESRVPLSTRWWMGVESVESKWQKMHIRTLFTWVICMTSLKGLKTDTGWCTTSPPLTWKYGNMVKLLAQPICHYSGAECS